MQTRPLGSTGLQVSALSYGASSFGGAFGPVDEAEALRVVHTALDLGINFIDVSPYYGKTRAETVLGEILQAIPRDRYLLSTKAGRYDSSEFDFSAERITRSVDESLRRLKTDYVDLLLCHDIEFGDLSQIIHETIPALRRVQAQGKIRLVGISGLPLAIFEPVLAQTNVDVVLSYCHYTLFDTSLDNLVPLLTAKNVGVINAAPLSMGLLTGNPVPDWHPASPEIREACVRAAAFCRSRGVELAQLALQFAAANPNVATTLVGTSSAEEIRRNVTWSETPLDTELLKEVYSIFAPIHNHTWPSGRPENNVSMGSE